VLLAIKSIGCGAAARHAECFSERGRRDGAYLSGGAGMDIIAALGPWLKEVQPRFGPAIAPRFASIYDFTAADVAAAQVLRDKRRRRLADFFVTRPDAIIIVPSALCGFATWARTASFRAALATGAVASLSGLPQVSIPILRAGELPIGLGAIAAQGRDRALLAFATGYPAQRQSPDRSTRDTP